MNKKKRERGKEYNEKKRECEYYDRTTMDRRESTNAMESIGLQRVGRIPLLGYIAMHLDF